MSFVRPSPWRDFREPTPSHSPLKSLSVLFAPSPFLHRCLLPGARLFVLPASCARESSKSRLTDSAGKGAASLNGTLFTWTVQGRAARDASSLQPVLRATLRQSGPGDCTRVVGHAVAQERMQLGDHLQLCPPRGGRTKQKVLHRQNLTAMRNHVTTGCQDDRRRPVEMIVSFLQVS